jgi:hypothetical protein
MGFSLVRSFNGKRIYKKRPNDTGIEFPQHRDADKTLVRFVSTSTLRSSRSSAFATSSLITHALLARRSFRLKGTNRWACTTCSTDTFVRLRSGQVLKGRWSAGTTSVTAGNKPAGEEVEV